MHKAIRIKGYALPAVLFMLGMVVVSTVHAQGQSAATATYTNPVLNVVFADPSVIKAPDGWFYAYATRTYHEEKEMINLQIAKSRDLVHWQYLREGMPVKPAWADSTEQFWAPDIHYDKVSKIYYLYFASAHNGTNRHCIGIATSRAPEGPFTDIGHPLVCGRSYTHIDPMEFRDPKTGRQYILWGSDHAPIQIQQLEGWTKLAPNSQPHDLLIPRDSKDYDGMLEGPWMIYRKGYYYLFTSGNDCCGLHVHYAVMVARSRKLMGPYEKFRGADGSGNGVIVEKNAHWIAPGHNAIITTDGGRQYWILYHAIDPHKRFQSKMSPVGMKFDRRVMLLDKIIFKDGWPRIRNNSPSYAPVPAPIIMP